MQQCEQEERNQTKTKKLISKIFDFLAINYGHAWSKTIERSSYESRVGVWSEAVSGLDKWQLAYGKKKIMNGECHLEFPPTPAQFRVLCQSMPDNFYGDCKPVRYEVSRFDPNYDINWFMSLPSDHKLKVYEGAIIAYPALQYFLKTSNECFLDDSFQKSVWIKPMIQAFRSCYQIDSLIGFKIENLGTKAAFKLETNMFPRVNVIKAS